MLCMVDALRRRVLRPRRCRARSNQKRNVPEAFGNVYSRRARLRATHRQPTENRFSRQRTGLPRPNAEIDYEFPVMLVAMISELSCPSLIVQYSSNASIKFFTSAESSGFVRNVVAPAAYASLIVLTTSKLLIATHNNRGRSLRSSFHRKTSNPSGGGILKSRNTIFGSGKRARSANFPSPAKY